MHWAHGGSLGPSGRAVHGKGRGARGGRAKKVAAREVPMGRTGHQTLSVELRHRTAESAFGQLAAESACKLMRTPPARMGQCTWRQCGCSRTNDEMGFGEHEQFGEHEPMPRRGTRTRNIHRHIQLHRPTDTKPDDKTADQSNSIAGQFSSGQVVPVRGLVAAETYFRRCALEISETNSVNQ